MKSKHFRMNLFIIALTLTAQLAFASPTLRVGQNANSSTSTTANTPIRPNPCRRRCAIAYRRCLRAADGNPARRRACMLRYRGCLRHCID